MELVDKYRRYAEEALANARAVSDPNTKRDWLEIAEAWSELAAARLASLDAATDKSGKRSA